MSDSYPYAKPGEDIPANRVRVAFRMRRDEPETERLRAIMAAEAAQETA